MAAIHIEIRGRSVSVRDAPSDPVKLTVPLLIRLLEFAREDTPKGDAGDVELHRMVERLAEAGDGVLGMDAYEPAVKGLKTAGTRDDFSEADHPRSHEKGSACEFTAKAGGVGVNVGAKLPVEKKAEARAAEAEANAGSGWTARASKPAPEGHTTAPASGVEITRANEAPPVAASTSMARRLMRERAHAVAKAAG